MAQGLRRRLLHGGLMIGAGALAAAAMPPLGVVPVLVLAFLPLMRVIGGGAGLRQVLTAGWLWGFGHFVAGLYWVGNAMLVDPDRHGWMIPFAVGGLAAILAVFPALAAALTRLGRSSVSRWLVFAGAWGLMELVRARFLTGFPWNPMGSVWSETLAVLQITALVGVTGLSILTVLTMTAPALLGTQRRAGAVACLCTAVALSGVAAWGQARLMQPIPEVPDAPLLRLVQPNTPQQDKWRNRDERLRALVALSQSPGWGAVDAVIWPETAATFVLNQDASRRTFAAQAAPPGGLLLTGTIMLRQSAPKLTANSMAAMRRNGSLVASYDKIHLVPFGEYVPLADVLPMQRIVPGQGSFLPGKNNQPLDIQGFPSVRVLICYEVIFGHEVRSGHRPAWLLTITNDAWFGMSAGPVQHMESARLRAVELGLPLVRVANTGISAVVDAQGRYVAVLPLGKKGFVDVKLPPSRQPTVYAHWGDLIPLIAGFLLINLGVGLRGLTDA